jgi:hypothetical protein
MLHSYGRGMPPHWRSRTAEPLSRDRRHTSRQFRGKKTQLFGDFAVHGFRQNLAEMALRWGEF